MDVRSGCGRVSDPGLPVATRKTGMKVCLSGMEVADADKRITDDERQVLCKTWALSPITSTVSTSDLPFQTP
jgi:hypothetical protein